MRAAYLALNIMIQSHHGREEEDTSELVNVIRAVTIDVVHSHLNRALQRPMKPKLWQHHDVTS